MGTPDAYDATNVWVAKKLNGKPDIISYFTNNITAPTAVGRLDQIQSLAARAVLPPAKQASTSTVGKAAQPPTINDQDKPVIGAVQQAAINASKDLSGSSKSAKNAIIDSARSTIAAFQRPNDVGCAMAILSWNSVRYAFGQTLADEFIAIQIVVRNMNSQQEFLVHDAEFSVDADLLGAHGRYFSGLDKLTVRQFMLSSRDYGRRNFVVNIAQGIGTILSATTPVFGGSLANASSVYNAGFLNAINNVWKDHNTEQLNLLNDVGFSASRTDRTVVPKSGTVMFVIFVPSKQFQTGWWVQECANVIVTSKGNAQGKDVGFCTSVGKEDSSSLCVEPQDAYKELRRYSTVRTGIDLDAARAVCQKYYPGSVGTTIKSTTSGTTTVTYLQSPKSIPYQHWTDNANAIFRELSFAVVAGTHVQEEQDNTPVLAKLDCPVDGEGNVDLSKASNGQVICTANGQNLDKVANLKLRNAQDQSDQQTADGSLTTSGDSKTGKASFDLDQIGKLNQKAYKVGSSGILVA